MEDYEEYRGIRKKRKNTLPSFSMFGDGNDNRNFKGKSMDAISYIEDMNPKSDEMKAWKYIKEARDKETNLVIVKLSADDKRNYFYKGIKVLAKDDIVRKEANGVYMINPFFFIPSVMNEETTERWESLKKRRIDE